MRVIKVSRPDVSNASYVLSALEADKIIDEINEMFVDDEPGNIIQIELLEISQKTFNSIEEFQGW